MRYQTADGQEKYLCECTLNPNNRNAFLKYIDLAYFGGF